MSGAEWLKTALVILCAPVLVPYAFVLALWANATNTRSSWRARGFK